MSLLEEVVSISILISIRKLRIGKNFREVKAVEEINFKMISKKIFMPNLFIVFVAFFRCDFVEGFCKCVS